MIGVSFWEKMNAAYYDMVDLKVSLGYSAATYTAAHILPFLEYGAAAFPDAGQITKEILDSWLVVREFATDNTRKHVIINLRHFTRYLNAVGYTAFVPTGDYNIRIQRYQPYIFTDFELQCLFDTIDDVKPCPRSHAELILPVLFRLELCCGMRPNEPLNLRKEDVNLRTGDVFIRKSKRGKTATSLSPKICESFVVDMTNWRGSVNGFSSIGMEVDFHQHGQGTVLMEPGSKAAFQTAKICPALMTFGTASPQGRLCAGWTKSVTLWHSSHF